MGRFVAVIGLVEVRLGIAIVLVLLLVRPEALLEPHLLHVRGPRFLEPGVRILATDHGIAEVAVGHFVEVDLVHQAPPLGGQPLVQDERVIPGHQRDVLHGAADARHRQLEVLGNG